MLQRNYQNADSPNSKNYMWANSTPPPKKIFEYFFFQE